MKKLIALLIVCVAFATAPAFSDGLERGIDAYQNGDYATALTEFRLLAEQGDANAQNNLGAMYERGDGVPQDYKESVKWYRLAAEQGAAYAQNNLGQMYNNGEGVQQDYKQAVKWYKISAEQGFAEAHNNLGAKYGAGQGVPQDYVRAHMWFNLGASNGSELALENRDDVAKHMTSSQLEKAQELARECLAKDYKGC